MIPKEKNLRIIDVLAKVSGVSLRDTYAVLHCMMLEKCVDLPYAVIGDLAKRGISKRQSAKVIAGVTEIATRYEVSAMDVVTAAYQCGDTLPSPQNAEACYREYKRLMTGEYNG